MPKCGLPISRWRLGMAFLLWFCLGAAWRVDAGALAWDPLADGLEIAAWAPGAVCSEDLSTVIVRIDPERFIFSVYQFRDEGLSAPVPLAEWQRRTSAALLFNAGLFLDDFSYMGLLYRDGRPLNPKRHAQWQGLFVAEPVERGMPRARILDLSLDTFPEDPVAYREAAQALMVLDRSGTLRVRKSGKRAQQTLLAEDANGYMYVIKTVTAASLFGLGECMRAILPWLRQVMAMDGGSSSDLLIGADTLARAGKTAVAAPWRSIVDGTAPAAHIPLPTVIGIRPRPRPILPPGTTASPNSAAPH